MKRVILAVLALMLPLAIVSSVSAAPIEPSGSLLYRADLAPVDGYNAAGPGNTSVDNVYFTVTTSGIPKFAQPRVLIECFDDAGSLIYKSAGTPVKNTVDTKFFVSLVNSVPSNPDYYLAPDESGTCDATLSYDTWSRKTLYQFGGELHKLPRLFTIG
jgi:hypothetical protein